VPQVALRWINDRPGITAAIIGASKPSQIDDNLGAGGWSLSEDQMNRLNEASAIELGYPYDFIQRLNAQSAPSIPTPQPAPAASN
jgi:diketogulonate reductase-like aldo/keto reductase